MGNRELFESAKRACRNIIHLTELQINDILHDLANLTLKKKDYLLLENRKDLVKMDPENPKYDRLKLTKERIDEIVYDLKNVAGLKTPLGRVIEERELKNSLQLKKVRVPLGVVGIIYEARPNVTFDVFSLCLKSGNVCLLKGGSDADNSNRAIVSLIHEVLAKFHVEKEIVQLLPPIHEATSDMLTAIGYVDIIIPRGSQELIDFVRQNAKVPVIETGAGIVHTYFDKSGNKEKARKIITNAKLRRVSVCNALDCLIIHRERLADLPFLVGELGNQDVDIFADPESFDALRDSYPGTHLFPVSEDHYGTEFLSKKMAVKTVKDLQEALDHIYRYSSRHSEAIIAEDDRIINQFLTEVDAAVVYANTSTAFTDGAQFEMGAEIGISTQKLHARGPMALEELTSYKWIIKGDGQIRE